MRRYKSTIANIRKAEFVRTLFRQFIQGFLMFILFVFFQEEYSVIQDCKVARMSECTVCCNSLIHVSLNNLV